MKNKIGAMLLSVVIAFGLWLYVISVVSPDSEGTVYDIPVSIVGETVLNERGLMITSMTASNVDLTLYGNRSDLNEVNAANITLKADLSNIYEDGVHQIEYNISFPGTVASNAFEVLSKYPSTINVTVEKKAIKYVPVQIAYEGTVPESYIAKKGDVVQDMDTITVTGPSSVVEKIAKAVITIPLTDQVESISQNYRFTLSDEEGNPVDSELITVNVEEVHVDLTIHRIKEVELVVNLVDGGGATSETAKCTVEPQTIQMSGSDAALELVGDTIVLGTIKLADYTEDTALTYTIPVFEGVTNESNLTEASAVLQFQGLSTKELTIEQFTTVNVPEGYEAKVITEKLTVTVRGPSDLVNRLTAADMVATVDFAGQEAGTATYQVSVTFSEAFASVGVIGKPSVSASLQTAENK